jgi:hypothetical protein
MTEAQDKQEQHKIEADFQMRGFYIRLLQEGDASERLQAVEWFVEEGFTDDEILLYGAIEREIEYAKTAESLRIGFDLKDARKSRSVLNTR